MVIVYVLVIILFSFLLIKSADLALVSLKKISRRTHTGAFALPAVILAIGTSLPELFVAITSGLQNVSNFSLGVILGSNIANTTLVLGSAALLSGTVYVRGNLIKRDISIAFIAGMLPLLFILDGTLSRIDGLTLLAVYGAYASSFFRGTYKRIAKEEEHDPYLYRILKRFNEMHFGAGGKDYGKLFVSVALLLFSADMIVRSSRALAEITNVPIFVVGVILIAIGATLPELAFSLRALKEHSAEMFYGNILGSIIANSTLIVGIAAILSPVKIVALDKYLFAAGAFVFMFIFFWLFTYSKRRLDRWEAAILLGLYIVFVILEFL